MKKLLKKKQSHPYFAGVAIVFLLLFLFFQAFQIYSLRRDMGFVKNLREANDGVLDIVSRSSGDLNLFADDLNEIRSFLLLPKREYSFASEVAENEVENLGEDVSAQVFGFLDALGTYEIDRLNYEKLQNFAAAYVGKAENIPDTLLISDPSGVLTENAWQVSFFDAAAATFPVFELNIFFDGKWSIDKFSQPNYESGDELETLEAALAKTFNEDSAAELVNLNKSLEASRFFSENVFAAQNFIDVLNVKTLKLSERMESPETLYFELLNKDSVAVAKFIVNKKDASMEIQGVDTNKVVIHRLLEGELEKIVEFCSQELDVRTAHEKRLDEIILSLENLRNDRGFKKRLSDLQLVFGERIESDAAFEYHILNSKNEIVRTLVLDKMTAELSVKDVGPLSAAIEELRRFEPSKKKV